MIPFADPWDVAARWRPLTPAEETVAGTLCDDASSLIRARFPGIDSQVTSGAIDSNILTIVVSGMVKRALISSSAEGVTQQSDTAGPFSQSRSFANPMQNVFLIAADLVLIIGYQPSASSHKFGNTTTHVEGSGPEYVYGDFDYLDTITGWP